MYPCLTITRKYVKTVKPPCTERYARWCGRSAAQLMSSLLLDLEPFGFSPTEQNFGQRSEIDPRKEFKDKGMVEVKGAKIERSVKIGVQNSEAKRRSF
jgi:hypothetical protein